MEPQGDENTGAAGKNGTTKISAAMEKAADEFLAEAGLEAAPAAASDEGAATEAPPEPAPAAEAKPSPEDELRREFATYAQAQERWGRDRERLVQQARSAGDAAKREILDALSSDDPDGALERLGIAADQRKLLARRLVLRHVPADKAPAELAAQIREENLRAEIRALNKRIDGFDEERKRERQEASQRQQAEQALSTLHEAFRSAGDELKHVRVRYGKRRDVVIRDALELGRDLAAKGTFSSRMSEAEIARKIVKELNDHYREEFGLADGSSSPAAAPATPNPATSSRPAIPPRNAAEVSAARTISRGATEVTRPPPSQEGPLSEDAWFEEEAKLMAKLRREGKFGSSA